MDYLLYHSGRFYDERTMGRERASSFGMAGKRMLPRSRLSVLK